MKKRESYWAVPIPEKPAASKVSELLSVDDPLKLKLLCLRPLHLSRSPSHLVPTQQRRLESTAPHLLRRKQMAGDKLRLPLRRHLLLEHIKYRTVSLLHLQVNGLHLRRLASSNLLKGTSIINRYINACTENYISSQCCSSRRRQESQTIRSFRFSQGITASH